MLRAVGWSDGLDCMAREPQCCRPGNGLRHAAESQLADGLTGGSKLMRMICRRRTPLHSQSAARNSPID